MTFAARDPYVMLIASLPALGPLLGSQTPAISAARLDERLALLTPADHASLAAVREVLAWSPHDPGETDVAFLDRVDALMPEIRQPALREAVRDRLEIRTAVGALRRRAAGRSAPAPGERWGYGRFLRVIRDRWAEPDFRLSATFPWIAAARQRLEAGDAAGLERIVLQAAWDAAARRAEGHLFDFEAVAFYVLRWALADRWSRYDVAAATARFRDLVDASTVDLPLLIETSS